MRILRVAQKVYPDVVGGGPYHVHAMSRDQAAMGHDVTVLTVTDNDSLPRQEERDGYTVVRRKSNIELLGNDVSLGVGKFLMQAEEYDVIHAHSHLYFSTNLAALKRHYKDTPLAITNHGLYSQNAPKWVFDTYLRTLGRWTFNSADVIFCYTEEDRERVQELDVSTDVEVVANGIDQTRFTPEGPESDRMNADGPVILFVGRLVEGKRPQDAINAFDDVCEAYPDAELYLCGDGPLREELQMRAAELGISEAVTFLGHVAYEEMPNMYRSADLLVLPSRAEGLPRTVLESLASATPVVTSNLKQVSPVSKQGGAVAPIGDVEAFAEELKALLDVSKKRRQYGQSGRRYIAETHTWKTTVRATTDKLLELCNQNS